MNKRLKPEYFILLQKSVAELFPLQKDITDIMIKTGLSLGQADMQGSGEKIWNSVLVLAEDKNKLAEVVSYVIETYPNITDLVRALTAIKDGSAFITEIRYEDYIKPPLADAVKVFLVYDKVNEKNVEEVKMHLSTLEKYQRSITLYDPHKQLAGTADLDQALLEELGNSQIVLLLLTPAFMFNPDNCCDPLAFASIQMRKRTIPVLLEDCDWKRIQQLSGIVPLPTTGEFISNYSNRNKILVQVTKELDMVVQAIKGKV
jgi:hypothetical protein